MAESPQNKVKEKRTSIVILKGLNNKLKRLKTIYRTKITKALVNWTFFKDPISYGSLLVVRFSLIMVVQTSGCIVVRYQISYRALESRTW